MRTMRASLIRSWYYEEHVRFYDIVITLGYEVDGVRYTKVKKLRRSSSETDVYRRYGKGNPIAVSYMKYSSGIFTIEQ
jgi:hypothetical protein